MIDFEPEFSAKIWCYVSTATWYFVSLPADEAGTVRALQPTKGGFGSVPVMVTVGATEWKTSLFPDKKQNSYILPLKAEIRKKEGLSEGDTITLKIRLLASL